MNYPARRSFGLRFWLVTLAALATIVATGSLGRWQLSRAAQMRAMQAAIDERQAMAPLEGAGLPLPNHLVISTYEHIHEP